MVLVIYPGKALRKKCYPVASVGEAEKLIFDEMIVVMKQNNGIGLAAPQVGIPSRLIVAGLGEQVVKLANPKVVERSGSDVMEEGCLSLPGIRVSVKRPAEVTVTGYNENGEQVEIKSKGLPARVLQHEIDHINGRLIIDYLPWWERVKHFIKTEIKVLKGKQRRYNE